MMSKRKTQIHGKEARTKILKHAVEAQVVAIQDDDDYDDDQERSRKKSKNVMYGCLAILVVVGVVVGVIVATRDTGETSDQATVPTMSPPETSPPTTAETTAQPSSVPTGRTLDNFFCDQAIPLSLGGPPIADTIEGNVPIDDFILYCRGSELTPYIDEGRGVWYRYEGQGKPVQVKVQGQEVSLNVYEMPDGGAQNCSTGFATCPDDSFTGRSISWNAFTGIVYHILVSHQSFDGSIAFEISLVDNDLCQTALGPIYVDTPRTSFGTILAEPPRLDENVPSCGSSSSLVTAGAWYNVTGTGGQFTASTCGGTGFGTQISVFVGTCDSLECIDGNDDACGSQSLVAWESVPGTTYFVLVHSAGLTFGNFGLQIEAEGADFLPETLCGTSPRLVLGAPRAFNINDAAAPEDDVETCDAPTDPMFWPEALGLWFRVRGTGNQLLVEVTDTEGGVFDAACGTSIIVTTGSRCSELSCVVSDCFESCDFPSVALEDYYFFVNDAFGSAADIDGLILVSEL